ncbi:MAX network transcriptional repressor b isoform X2 [Pimephales promelas]|uniref:MAX network transcriptional repressor b isoform X2 n=1 Tax=Pimephales promelas TaxID=90988 RepID=UPI001955DA03|nr:MAX network transcriptional repressor b isoform X2 [Pimephales promelas]KAG1970059.1 max-binding protein MNT [Pimephales promelas]
MSIDTLLEAARYLEWQSQQQQITREEEQQREKALLSREAEQKLSAPVIQTVQLNHVTWAEDMRLGSHLGSHQHHPPVPPPPLPPPVPIAVIPIPMVPANPAGLPIQTASSLHTVSPMPVVTSLATALSPQAAAPLFSPNGKDAHSPPPPLPPLPQQQRHLIAHVKTETNSLSPSNNGAKQLQTQTLLQSYPAPIITAQHTPQQHTLLPQPALPQPQPTPAQAQAGQPPRTNGATVEDPRNLDGKRRPGGRAHLKECFDTLKKNVPNVDEKKTSNLSVLRSALRYIQTLKRKEKEYEHEMERLAREKIATQQRLAELKNELSQCIDVIEIDRILRQTVQPEDDQASTSTASEGEDNFDQDVEDDILSSPPSSSAPKLPAPSEPRPAMPPPSILPTHISIQHKPATPPSHPQAAVITPQAIAPAPPSHIISPPQQTVITHASVSHASVIQAVNHVIPAGSKHLAHIAPSSAGQPIGHITVHPVTHLPAAIYPQSVAVSQPAMVGHITHALAHHPHAHAQVNGTPVTGQQATMVGKPTAVVAHHHTGLVGQTVLNPVTMVTVPPFPVSTLKLA